MVLQTRQRQGSSRVCSQPTGRTHCRLGACARLQSFSWDSLYVLEHSREPQRTLRQWHKQTPLKPLHKRALIVTLEKSSVSYQLGSHRVRLVRTTVSNAAHAVLKSLDVLGEPRSLHFHVKSRVSQITSGCYHSEVIETQPVSQIPKEHFLPTSLQLRLYSARRLSLFKSLRLSVHVIWTFTK